jgi:hypothetical protein
MTIQYQTFFSSEAKGFNANGHDAGLVRVNIINPTYFHFITEL